MRAAVVLIFACAVVMQSQVQAQTPLAFQAGLGYARVFDGGGFSFAAAVDRLLSPPATRLQHALGGSFWYARTGIGSRPSDSEGRTIMGLGARYQVSFRSAENFRPFVALPVQLLQSNIPDRTNTLAASLHGVPDPGPEPTSPVQDLVGTEWGWGTGVEVGFRIGTGRRLSGQTSVQVLYQDIYGSATPHGAWSWHAGISYALFDR